MASFCCFIPSCIPQVLFLYHTLLLTLNCGVPRTMESSRFFWNSSSTREMPSALCLSFPICEARVLGPTGACPVYLEQASESLMLPWLGSEGRVLRGCGEPALLVLRPHPDAVRPPLWSSPRTLSYFPLLVFLTRIPHTWTEPSCYPGGHQ